MNISTVNMVNSEEEEEEEELEVKKLELLREDAVK